MESDNTVLVYCLVSLIAYGTLILGFMSTIIYMLMNIETKLTKRVRRKKELIGGFIPKLKEKNLKAYDPSKDPHKIALGEVEDQFN